MKKDRITLDPKILEKLKNKTGIQEKSIRNAISKEASTNPHLSVNARAFLYGTKKGVPGLNHYLSAEDKRQIGPLQIQSHTIIKKKLEANKIIINSMVKYDALDMHVEWHLKEIDRAYHYECFTCVFVITRKVIENLIIKILEKKYPNNKNLYYDLAKFRALDFSVVLKNLYDKRVDFNLRKTAIERLNTILKPLKDDFNDKAHSLYHIVRKKAEIDNLGLQEVFELIKELEKEVGLRTNNSPI